MGVLKINQLERTIFDSLYDGVLIADQNCIVQYINPSYTRITKMTEEEMIGRPLAVVRPGAQLPAVIKTGKQQLRANRMVDGIEYMVNMVPIIEKHQIIGGISILNEINDVYKLTQALNQSNLMIKRLEKHVNRIGRAKYDFEDIIGVDPASLETKEFAKKMAAQDSHILITGESGTGKELYANAIHKHSARRNGPFIAVNCASFESNLLESELFGYEEGAFTGAKKGGKIGLFEIAHRGTLFLDEISEMNYSLQAKLLRALQEKCIRRIGGVSEIPIDIRLISATNKDLEQMIEQNTFRRDLYYRVAVIPLAVPPLRERRGDIPALARHFLEQMGEKLDRRPTFSDQVLRMFLHYSWPGNIRELKNTVEFAVNMAEGSFIKPEELPKAIQTEGIKQHLIELRTLDAVIRETEKQEIRKALLFYGNTVEGKKKAAESLGISLATLYNKLAGH